MKKIFLSFLIVFLFMDCNDKFMERFPSDSLTEENFWSSAEELREFVNQLYSKCSTFAGHGTFHDMSPLIIGDEQSDNLVPLVFNVVAAGQYVVPPSGGGWDFTFIRDCNYFLTRYQKANISEKDKNTYGGEVKVFRAIRYFELVKRFGNVPWISKDLNIDSEELYGTRTSREVVMDSVISDLNWAIQKLPTKEESAPGRINRDIALAIKARVSLYEGTWERYHGGDIFGVNGSDGNYFMQQAYDASLELMNGNYKLHNTGNPQSDYQDNFMSLDLSTNSEIIMYRDYAKDLLGTRTDQYIQDNQFNFGADKSLVDSYLSKDGKPINISPLYLGDNSIENEMSNRDPRLTQTIVFPKTNQQRGLPGPPIPGTSFGGSSLGAGLCPTGYQILKYWVVDDQEEYLRIQNGILDASLIRYAEVLLINAEAAFELGILDQTKIDKTINLLRDRVGMPHFVLNEVESWGSVSNYKFNYSNIQSPVLNEIRRERRVELAVENLRYDDLMRWKEGNLLTVTVKGMKFDQATYPNVIVGRDIYVDDQGFILPYKFSLPNGRVFDEGKNYLFPLPVEELNLNENLKPNNPGWN